MGLLHNNRTTEDSGRGNICWLFGRGGRGTLSKSRPGAWSRGNPWLAEISCGFSETTPANKPCTPGRSAVASEIPGLRKFLAAFRKLHPRTCFVRPAGGLEPRQSLACGNFWRLFGNYTRGQALYTRPGFWSRGNSWLAEIPSGFLETTPANKLLSTANRCLANNKPYLACSETMSCLHIPECPVKNGARRVQHPARLRFSIKLYIFPSALLYRSRFC